MTRKSFPRPLYQASSGKVQDRAKERAAWMTERHPGVKFSLYVQNPLGVKESKKLGMPGAGKPQAIFDLTVKPLRDEAIKIKLLEAVKTWRSPLGYVAYTHLQKATGLTYAQIFGVFKAMYADDPYSVRFSINRMGDNVYVKVLKISGG